jgi:hypothetical protein
MKLSLLVIISKPFENNKSCPGLEEIKNSFNIFIEFIKQANTLFDNLFHILRSTLLKLPQVEVQIKKK